MSAAFQATEVEPLEGSTSLRVRLRVENRSGETWRTGEGFRIGYQVFDPATGIFLEEGSRRPLPGDLAPGESAEVELDLSLPAARGGYRIFVSAMRENVCWYYDRGWPFLLVEADVENGAARPLRSKVTTLGAMRRERRLRSVKKLLTDPFLSLWRNRTLVRSMVKRDVLGRYRGSFGGAFWTLLNPLLLMVTYFFVFGIVLRARFAGDPSRSGFVLYFLAGMLPWLPFSEAVGRAPFVLLEHRNFVKKLVFPLETLPVIQVAAGLVTQAFALGIFLVLRLAARGPAGMSLEWLPLLLVPQVLLTLGVCWFLAALGVYARDLGQINGFLLTLWFFLTPICYPEASLEGPALAILSNNPMFVLVRGYRAALLEGAAPAFGPLWKLWLLAMAVFLLGYAWFHKLRKSFADVI